MENGFLFFYMSYIKYWNSKKFVASFWFKRIYRFHFDSDIPFGRRVMYGNAQRITVWFEIPYLSGALLLWIFICGGKYIIYSNTINASITAVERHKTKTKLRGQSPRANYTDRKTAACQRS
jgi:hypothetical protein